MSTSKMYFAHGIRPDRFTLQCGNILLENKSEHVKMQEKNKKTQKQAEFLKFHPSEDFLAILPAGFSNDHLRSNFMKGLPEFRVLQSQPDVALEIGISASSHGGGRGAAEVGLQV